MKRYLIIVLSLLAFNLLAAELNECLTLTKSLVKTTRSQELVDALKPLDDLNGACFEILYNKNSAAKKSRKMFIFEEGKLIGDDAITLYPTAIAPKELMKHLPAFHYKDLLKIKSELRKKAKGATLWVKKMQAGTGSSLTRKSYLSKLLAVPEDQITLGAKGTDLVITIADPANPGQKKLVSVAEIQILQAIHEAKYGQTGELIIQDIVGPESQKSMAEVWEKVSLLDPTKTYRELVEATEGISSFGKVFQDHIPTIDKAGKITYERKAPGGHFVFAVDALRAAYDSKLRPKVKKGMSLIASIGNGEDLSSQPDDLILGLMRDKKIGIAMITTSKTGNDLKGGQIALAKKADGSVFATIMEKAQAEEADQLKLFEQLGLREGDDLAFFNTNMALFNYDVLTPKITKLVDEIGEDKFMEVISPDLIRNWKEQVGPDGTIKEFLQLEGAMGSVILNLDKFWRVKYGEPLVSFINIDELNRTKFFSPIKTAFDFFLQFFSDRFVLDAKNYKLINQRAGDILSAAFSDKYYTDVLNVVDSFEGASFKALNGFKVEGKVNAKGAILKGNVEIINEGTDIVDLVDLARTMPNIFTFKQNRLVLEDVKIIIDSNKKIHIE